MTAPTPRQEALAGSGDHHLILCLRRSPTYELPTGSYRFRCESAMGHGPPCGAVLENDTLHWNDERTPMVQFVMGRDDFEKLVAGDIVDLGDIHLRLTGIGFAGMRKAVARAEEFAALIERTAPR